MDEKWWRSAVIYQVYLRSFKDGNNDGIGDFIGLINQLDYFADLNIDALWISPHYDSPMDDNGYDIRNHYKVSSDYGTLNDVKRFIKKAHKLGIKVLFDFVLNHTSDEHPWFIAAKDPNHPEYKKYHDYYIWHKPSYDKNGNKIMPTNWKSWFGGPVWEYNELTNEYYLHIFSKKMPDLNWRNKSMKQDIKAIAKWWIDLGVDGFRVDAANHLEKNWEFPDAYPGYEHFSSLPKHHMYLQDIANDIFIPNNILAIGEAGGATKEEALQYASFASNEFDLLIHFGHCWADIDPSNEKTPGKWAKKTLEVSKVKRSFKRWYDMLEGHGWNIIYWHNHDQPRIISHYGDDTIYHNRSGKMLCYTLYYMPGTAILYQGEEIGMTNVDYQNLHQFRDVEVFTEYDNFIQLGATHQEAMQALRDRSRDNARTPFHWNDELYAGFSNTAPWIDVVSNYTDINLNDELRDSNSIFHVYKDTLKQRKQLHIANGSLKMIHLDDDTSFCYKNETKHHIVFVVSNFTSNSITIDLKNEDITNYFFYRSNSSQRPLQSTMELSPYESIVYLKKKA